MKKTIFAVTVFTIAIALTLLTNYISFTVIRSQEAASVFRSQWLEYRLGYESKYIGKTSTSFLSNQNCTQLNSGSRETEIRPRNSYQIVTNFITSNRELGCRDSYITYASHGDFRYLDNLVPVVERWQGPVSITLYIPNSDVYSTLERIAFLRECTSPLVKEFVTFHLFAEKKYFTDPIPIWERMKRSFSQSMCDEVPQFGDQMKTSRLTSNGNKRLLYPVNVGRNIARAMAQTHFTLVSDLELCPSLNVIPTFFEMLDREIVFFQNRTLPYVFVLPIFEVEEGYDVPDTRVELLDYISQNASVTFHRYVCPECHEVPRYEEWLKLDVVENQLNVFYTAKRQRPFTNWEPIFISTNDIPFYDERLSWEGLRDKMSQSYTMCVLDYDFMILDNAFLVHKPGIKTKKHNLEKPKFPIKRQNRMLARIQKQIAGMYGTREECNKGSR